MQQFCQYGSVRGATGNRRPYRENSYTPEPRSTTKSRRVVSASCSIRTISRSGVSGRLLVADSCRLPPPFSAPARVLLPCLAGGPAPF